MKTNGKCKWQALGQVCRSLLVLVVAGCQPSGERGTVVATNGGAAAGLGTPVPAGRTRGVERGAPADVAIWIDPERPGAARILVAAGAGGLLAYHPDGEGAGAADSLAAGLVAVVPGAGTVGQGGPLALVYDNADARIGAYRVTVEPFAIATAMPQPIRIDDELTGLCTYRSRLSGRDYVYAVTDAGVIHHYELFGQDDGVGARLLRTLPSGKGSGFCAVDPRDGMLYVSEESTGIWRFGAEAESDTTRELIDLREPFGSLSDDLKGLAVYPVNGDLSYLLVADVGKQNVAVYSLPDGEKIRTLAVAGLVEPEGAAATNAPMTDAFPAGMLVIADEDIGGGLPDAKLVDWQVLVRQETLQAAKPAPSATPPVVVRPVVRPIRETDVMPNFGDAADDPAIWRNPGSPEKSLVIGTNKQAGLHVYDLEGNTLQVLADGRMNNVDLREGFPLSGNTVPLVVASNRSNDSIAVYRIDTGTLQLVDVAAGVIDTGFSDPYGACMYHSRRGDYYVFVNEGGVGDFRQWRLFDDGSGRVAATLVREFSVGSQAEGCVADDATGALYVAEEDYGLWRYSAEPDGGTDRLAIDNVVDGRLTDDVEGVALVAEQDGSGYLVVSNQGADNYAVYRRGGDHEFVGFFHIVADAANGIDGASETDGIDATPAALGQGFARGLLVVQDGRNIAPMQAQNFKYVAWDSVLEALGEQ